jgi:hypothetical protein
VVFEHPGAAGVVRHTQHWAGGNLAAWVPGAPERPPDATIVCTQVQFGALWPAASLSEPGTEVQIRDANGGTWRCPPNAGDVARTSARQVVPGLTFSVRVTFDDFPLGTVTRDLCWADGVIDPEAGSVQDPDLSLSLPFPGGVGYLLGRLPFREIAPMADIAGGDLLLLAGLAGVLVRIGDTTSTPGTRAVALAVGSIAAIGKSAGMPPGYL